MPDSIVKLFGHCYVEYDNELYFVIFMELMKEDLRTAQRRGLLIVESNLKEDLIKTLYFK